MKNKRYRIISNGLKYKVQERVGFWIFKCWIDVQKPTDGSLLSDGPIIYNTLKEAKNAIEQLIKHDNADNWIQIPPALYEDKS